jgi:hypothetical protein
MFNTRIKEIRGTFIAGPIVALFFALAPNLFAQTSPLIIQPSSGNVGIDRHNKHA